MRGTRHGHRRAVEEPGPREVEATVRENEIDETILPSLTEENLKQLGVTALVHRLKLFDDIAALSSDVSGKAPSIDAATASSTPTTHPQDRAERRQVTVMVSDLVGSTVLSHCRIKWGIRTGEPMDRDL